MTRLLLRARCLVYFAFAPTGKRWDGRIDNVISAYYANIEPDLFERGAGKGTLAHALMYCLIRSRHATLHAHGGSDIVENMGYLSSIYYDTEGRAFARANQKDPWVMYLVAPKGTLDNQDAVLQASARVTWKAWELLASDEEWTEAYAHWKEESYRKVALRARAAQYAQLHDEFDLASIETYHASVAALPPRKKSRQEPLLQNMQAQFPPLAFHTEARVWNAAALWFVIRNDLGMSLGKAMAQISHAVLMAAEGFELANSDMPMAIRGADAGTFHRLTERYDAHVVRDAGFTEVASGSETVAAFAPQAVADWVSSLPAPIR